MTDLEVCQKLVKRQRDNCHDTQLANAILQFTESLKDKREGIEFTRSVIGVAERNILQDCNPAKWNAIRKRALRYEATELFDSYLIYLEYERAPKARFYLPRRKVFRTIVEDLQDLEDLKIDFYSLSCPPRVGKTALGIMFMSWVIGKHPDANSIMFSFSDKIAKKFYSGLLSVLTNSSDYAWSEVFPSNKIVRRNIKEKVIELNQIDSFPTYTTQSKKGTVTGNTQTSESGLLYCDDLIKDISEAKSPRILDDNYERYLTTLKSRKKEFAKELMIGTRWGADDPIGMVARQYKNNNRYRFKIIPALNENGESNFDFYPYTCGFSTKYYLSVKEENKDNNWQALYQNNPYPREGVIFHRDKMRFYNGELPPSDPDFKRACCDVAWGGNDHLAMVFAYIYGKDVYIHDVVYSLNGQEVTVPQIVGKCEFHKPFRQMYESNNGGEGYAELVKKGLEELGFRYPIDTKHSKGGKTERIARYSYNICQFWFRDDLPPNTEYAAFMRDLHQFTLDQVKNLKNRKDDAPDVLAMLAAEIEEKASPTVQIVERWW